MPHSPHVFSARQRSLDGSRECVHALPKRTNPVVAFQKVWIVEVGGMARFERLARLLEIFFQIRENPQLKPKDLARRFGVSERRIFDDLKELQRAGVPIAFVRGGYQIRESLFTSCSVFTLDEALKVIQGLVRLGADGVLLREDVARLVGKVLPPGGERLVRGDLPCSISAGERARSLIDPNVMAEVNKSIASQEAIEVRYRSRKDPEPHWRGVHPYHLIYRRESWYLVAYCTKHEEIRTFKVSRISEVRPLHEKFEILEDFSPEAYFQYRWGIFGGVGTPVRVRFDAEVGDLILEKQIEKARMWEETPYVYLEAIVANLEEFSWWLLQYGEHAEVLRPRKLRKAIAERARRMVNLYES